MTAQMRMSLCACMSAKMHTLLASQRSAGGLQSVTCPYHVSEARRADCARSRDTARVEVAHRVGQLQLYTLGPGGDRVQPVPVSGDKLSVAASRGVPEARLHPDQFDLHRIKCDRTRTKPTTSSSSATSNSRETSSLPSSSTSSSTSSCDSPHPTDWRILNTQNTLKFLFSVILPTLRRATWTGPACRKEYIAEGFSAAATCADMPLYNCTSRTGGSYTGGSCSP
jgi:hypothetical protein